MHFQKHASWFGLQSIGIHRFPIWKASMKYISIGDDDEHEPVASTRPSIFNHLGKCPNRSSVFDRLGEVIEETSSQRIKKLVKQRVGTIPPVS